MAVTDPAQASGRVRVAILGTGLMGRPDLRQGLAACGLEIAVEETLADFLSNVSHHDQIDVILVDLEQAEDEDLDILDSLVEFNPRPMVFHDVAGRAGDAAWLRRLAGKLSDAAGRGVPSRPAASAAVLAPSRQEPPRGLRCWVLGASFGGPEALKRFLSAIPELPPQACFIIGQHIGDGFVEVLAAQLNRVSPFRVQPAADGDVLESGCIYVAPVRERLRLEQAGVIRLEPELERHTYLPSIDCLMEEVAARFGAACGAIIFSGMGDDGTRGCAAIARVGGTVWAQDKASSAIDSMPACAWATGLVQRSGSPEQLAVALVQQFKDQSALP